MVRSIWLKKSLLLFLWSFCQKLYEKTLYFNIISNPFFKMYYINEFFDLKPSAYKMAVLSILCKILTLYFHNICQKLYQRKHFLLREVFNISGYSYFLNSTHVKQMEYSRFIKRHSLLNREEFWILQLCLNMSENVWIFWDMSEHIKTKHFLIWLNYI